MVLNLKVIPGASQNEIAGWLEDRLKVRVCSPANKGSANQALITLLADTLGVKPNQISIVSGTTSELKSVNISTLTLDEVQAKLLSKIS